MSDAQIDDGRLPARDAAQLAAAEEATHAAQGARAAERQGGQGFVGDPARLQVDPERSHQQSAAEESIDGLAHQQEDAREHPVPGDGHVSDPANDNVEEAS